MSDIISINPDNQAYLTHDWAILLFESPWCAGCKNLLNYMKKNSLVDEGIDCLLGKVDIIQNQPLAQQYNIISLPTVIVFHKGNPHERFSGTMSEKVFNQKIKKCIKNDP